jgi:hypothetical protein
MVGRAQDTLLPADSTASAADCRQYWCSVAKREQVGAGEASGRFEHDWAARARDVKRRAASMRLPITHGQVRDDIRVRRREVHR